MRKTKFKQGENRSKAEQEARIAFNKSMDKLVNTSFLEAMNRASVYDSLLTRLYYKHSKQTTRAK